MKNTKNTNTKDVNRTNERKPQVIIPEVTFNYQKAKYGGRTFQTTSELVRYMLTHNKQAKRSQSEIARMCGVSQPCVCQLARELKSK